MTISRAIAGALSLAVLCSAGSVHAAARNKVVAEITNIKIDVIDLRPEDGIAPSVTFGFSNYISRSSYRAYSASDSQYQETYSPGSTAIARSFGGTSGWSTPDTLGANAQVWTIDGLTDSAFNSMGRRELYYYGLSEGAVLRISGTVTLDISKAGEVSTFALAEVTGSTDLGYPETSLNNFSRRFDIRSGSLTQDFTADLAGDYRNNGYITFTAGASSINSPVPEPASYGMLLVGLGLLAMRGRAAAQRRISAT